MQPELTVGAGVGFVAIIFFAAMVLGGGLWVAAVAEDRSADSNPDDGPSIEVSTDTNELVHEIATATPTGDRVVCAGVTNLTAIIYHGLLYVWDVESGKLIHAIVSEATGYVQSMALSDDGQRIAAWPAKGGVGIWNLESGQQVFQFVNDNPTDSAPFREKIPGALDQVLGMKFSHDGSTLAIGDLVGVKLIESGTGEVRQKMEAPFRYSSSPFNSPAFVFSPNDRLLLRYGVHLSDPRKSLLWDARTGKQLALLPIDGTAAAFSNGSDWLAIGRNDDQQAIALWKIDFDVEH